MIAVVQRDGLSRIASRLHDLSYMSHHEQDMCRGTRQVFQDLGMKWLLLHVFSIVLKCFYLWCQARVDHRVDASGLGFAERTFSKLCSFVLIKDASCYCECLII